MRTRIKITTGYTIDDSEWKEIALTPYICASYQNSKYMYDKSFMIGVTWLYQSFYIDFNIYRLE